MCMTGFLDATTAAVWLSSPAGQAALARFPYDGLLVDLDDTLLDTRSRFVASRQASAMALARLDRNGYSREELTAIQRAVSDALLPNLGLSNGRWRTATVLAGQVLAGRELGREERAALLAAAEIAFQPGLPLPGAVETVRACRAAGLPLVLWTQGEPHVQTAKHAANGLGALFDAVEIVPWKTAPMLRCVAAVHGFARPLVIGDSPHGDIAPALAAGIAAILVQGGVRWPFDDDAQAAAAVPQAASFAQAVALAATSV